MSATQAREAPLPEGGASVSRSLQLAVMRSPSVSVERAAQRARTRVEETVVRGTAFSYARWAQAAA